MARFFFPGSGGGGGGGGGGGEGGGELCFTLLSHQSVDLPIPTG